jgi:cytoskeletal protein CcmA (bactofilin family)
MSVKISPESIVGFLGPGTELTGGLSFTGSLRVDGLVRGGHLEGPTLVVGEHADLQGSIEVDDLSVQGRVKGDVLVRRNLEILPGGRVEGKVRLARPCLTLEEGGTLDGTIEILGSPAVPAVRGARSPESRSMFRIGTNSPVNGRPATGQVREVVTHGQP